MPTSRRDFLSLSTLGLTAIGATLGALTPERSAASPHTTPAPPNTPDANNAPLTPPNAPIADRS